MKGRLKKYKCRKFQSLNSGEMTMILTIETLFLKRLKTVEYGIPEHSSFKKYTDHWDNLIKNNKMIKV